MPYAICIRCGEGKLSPFSPCPNCEFVPRDPKDQARSLLLSDRNTDRQTLQLAGEKIRAGQAIQYDEPVVESLARQLDRIASNPNSLKGCTIIIWLFSIIALFVIGALVFTFFFAP